LLGSAVCSLLCTIRISSYSSLQDNASNNLNFMETLK
jgi:hypothetical protein